MKQHVAKLQGYRAYCLGVPREKNWHQHWRGTLDYPAWFAGWDLAQKDLNKEKEAKK